MYDETSTQTRASSGRLSALHPPERHGASGCLTVLKIHNRNNLRGRGGMLMIYCLSAPRLLWLTKTLYSLDQIGICYH